MTREEQIEMARRLRQIAREVEETARGSSRISMYVALAGAIAAEAYQLEIDQISDPRRV